MCQWALTGKQTLWGGGALEVGDLRLFEDDSELSDTHVSKAVALETASRMGNGERVACQWALTER